MMDYVCAKNILLAEWWKEFFFLECQKEKIRHRLVTVNHSFNQKWQRFVGDVTISVNICNNDPHGRVCQKVAGVMHNLGSFNSLVC